MKNTLIDKSFIEMDGHVLIKDVSTGEILLDKHNAINFENMSVALANSISNKTDGNGNYHHIARICYGNGGTVLGASGSLEYQDTNTEHTAGVLHNQTYHKDIDNSEENKIIVKHEPGEHYTDIEITSTLDYSEPNNTQLDPNGNPYNDQQVIDNTLQMEGEYVFDELGIQLFTNKFISHIIFHPIEKSANRKIQVIYTVRIRAGK